MAYFCAAESVAAMMMRFLPASAGTNWKLELVVLTNTRRAGLPSSAAFHSFESMSGPDEIEFGGRAVERAVSQQHDQQRVVGSERTSAMPASRVTFSRVAAVPADPVSVSTVMRSAGNPSRFDERGLK